MKYAWMATYLEEFDLNLMCLTLNIKKNAGTRAIKGYLSRQKETVFSRHKIGRITIKKFLH